MTNLVLGYPATSVPDEVRVNPFRAALCERARVVGMPVRITWKDGRMSVSWGPVEHQKTRDIVTVSLEGDV